MREHLAHDNAGGRHDKAVLQSITVKRVCAAYAASTQSQRTDWSWLFGQKYLDLEALKRAVATNDDSIGRVGECKTNYETNEAAILDSKGGKAFRYQAAADWCAAAKLKGEEFRILSRGKQHELLLKMWAEERPMEKCSLKSLFNNGPFSIDKLNVYGAGGRGAAGLAGSGSGQGRRPWPWRRGDAAAAAAGRRRRDSAAR